MNRSETTAMTLIILLIDSGVNIGSGVFFWVAKIMANPAISKLIR